VIPNNCTFANHVLLDFVVQGKKTEVDTPTVQLGATPSKLVSDPPPSSPIFTPYALPAATLPIYPGLGQAQDYAGLHTPRLVSGYQKFTLQMTLAKPSKSRPRMVFPI